MATGQTVIQKTQERDLHEAARLARPARVLVAEDDAEMRSVVAAAVRKDGYEVVEARDGAEVLDLIGDSLLRRKPDPPDVLITDIRMPGFSGLQVLAGLRQADWKVPVILITAFGDPGTHAQARRLGAVAVFDKPFDVDDLRTVVMNLVLGGRRHLDGDTCAAPLIRCLADSFDGHRAWLSEFNRALVCQRPADARPGPSSRCVFARWAEGSTAGDETLATRLAELRDLHDEVHDKAAELATLVGAGRSIPVKEYDAFARLSRRFAQEALDLERATRDQIAEIDPLTGLFNRRSMWRQLEAERQRGRRAGRAACVAMVDLDGFKNVNDRHGHRRADSALRAVARRFDHGLRPYDTLYRYGGDELLICLPEAAPETARKVLRRLTHHAVLPDGAMLTASIGVASLTSADSVGEAIERADRAAYASKRLGGGRVELWRPEEEIDHA